MANPVENPIDLKPGFNPRHVVLPPPTPGKNTTVTAYLVDSVVYPNEGLEDSIYHKPIKVTIPEGYTSIETSAFDGYLGLTKINIPTTCTVICTKAFSMCTSLTAVTIGDGVTIQPKAFSMCTSMTTVAIGTKCSGIADSAFRRCESLTTVTIGAGCNEIGQYAFELCEKLIDVFIKDTIPKIAPTAFYGCELYPVIIFGHLGIAQIAEFEAMGPMNYAILTASYDKLGSKDRKWRIHIPLNLPEVEDTHTPLTLDKIKRVPRHEIAAKPSTTSRHRITTPQPINY